MLQEAFFYNHLLGKKGCVEVMEERIFSVIQLLMLGLTLGVTVFLAYRTARLNQKVLTLRAAEDFAEKDKTNQAALERILEASILLHEKIAPEKLRMLEQNPEHRLCLLTYLNHYESLARGVNMGIYDEEVIRVARKSLMIKEFRLWEGYIEDYRKRFDRPLAWCEFERLVKRWTSPKA